MGLSQMLGSPFNYFSMELKSKICHIQKQNKALHRNGIRLKDFVFNLAMALIRSADERM
jgi:hypothetical protein